MANTAVNSLSGFVFWTVAARFYTTDDVGVASAMISAMMLLSNLSGLGLVTGLIRFLPGASDTRDWMLDSSITLVTLVSILAVIIFLVGLPLWSPALTFMYGQPVVLIGFVLFVVSFALARVVTWVFVAYRAAHFTLLCSVITSVLKLPFPILLAAFYGPFGIFAAVGLAATVTLGIALMRLLPTVQSGYVPRLRMRGELLRALVPYSIGNQIAALLAQAPQIILPIMVLNVLGAKESAYSYVTWMLANVLFTISGAISTSTFAEGSNQETSVKGNVQSALGLTALLSAPAILLTLIVGDRLLLFFGREYARNGASLLGLLALSALPVGVNNIYFAIKRVTREINVIFSLSIFIAGGTLALSYVLMPRYGIAGTGIGWLASQGMVTGLIVCSALSRFARLRGRRSSRGR
jgi:O-antigen/teichoic acid export membrane protein